MSDEPNLLAAWRGCASKFSQPLRLGDELTAQYLVDKVELVNCQKLNHPLSSIIYRTGDKEKDILRQVFRWDFAPYDEVFPLGFRAPREHGTLDDTFYNLCDYVTQSGRPLDSRLHSKFALISTTISNSWYPHVLYDDDAVSPGPIEVYRYEIYAPGGIWVGVTLGDRYGRDLNRQDQVAFVDGIAPPYIRSAQLFRITPNSDSTTAVEKVDDALIINSSFDPQSDPSRMLTIENPISHYTDDLGRLAPIKLTFHQDEDEEAPSNLYPWTTEWYARKVVDEEAYMGNAFRSCYVNDAYYIFVHNVCSLVDYIPGRRENHILTGPSLVSKIFQSLKHTPFGEHGIDCAFASHNKGEAFIFCANLCALIYYEPPTNHDNILKGPMTITQMFPFFKGTVFEDGIDGAFEATNEYEAYLFKGDPVQCAHIYYGSNAHIIAVGPILEIFPALEGTAFEYIQIVHSAYASHIKDEAYLFQYNSYRRLNLGSEPKAARGDDSGVYIGSNGSLGIAGFLPHQNRGIDVLAGNASFTSDNPHDYEHDDLLES